MMLQLWLVSAEKLSPEQLNRIKSDFVRTRKEVVDKISSVVAADLNVTQLREGGETQ